MRFLLSPIALIYWLAVKVRNFMFDAGLRTSVQPSIKTICVGNLTVGGTGKTPHTEYLIRLLSPQMNIATLSRGYRRTSKGYMEASSTSTALEVGDEPLQMKLKFPHIAVAVDANRIHGVEQLQRNHSALNLVLLDDAFQHRRIAPGLSILLTDYNNPISHDFMLPVGLLRDSFAERKRADMVVVTKCPKHITALQMETIARQLKLKPDQKVFFSYIDYGMAHSVFNAHKQPSIKLSKLNGCYAFSGIATPAPFFAHIAASSNLIGSRAYADHHKFTETEINAIFAKLGSRQNAEAMLITTEKDATRLRNLNLPDEVKQRLYYLEIVVNFVDNQAELFNETILRYARED